MNDLVCVCKCYFILFLIGVCCFSCFFYLVLFFFLFCFVYVIIIEERVYLTFLRIGECWLRLTGGCAAHIHSPSYFAATELTRRPDTMVPYKR